MKPESPRQEQSLSPAPERPDLNPASATLLESFLSKENLARALRRVEQNAGAPGPDGMTTRELRPFLHAHWPEVREKLEAGTYRPSPVRRVTIPKPGGGERLLGVPTVLDRFIQQALLQVLDPIFDPHFADQSYGFRPGRSAHPAVRRAQEAIAEGHTWVVDLDLEAFFDRVNHDALMARVARKVKDKKVLKLLRAYLERGHHGRRRPSPLPGRHPPGLTPLAPSRQRHAGRPRPGAGLSWPPVRQVRGRPHDLREEQAGGGAGHGQHQRVRRETAKAPGERGEIGGGSGHHPPLPRLLVLPKRRRGQGEARPKSPQGGRAAAPPPDPA